MSRLSARLGALLLSLATLLIALPTRAQDNSGLLPVTDAFKLSTDASSPGVIKLHWVIAPHYYLYRGRMAFKGGDGITLGEAKLPDGNKHVDPYLGPVETYHNAVDATIPYTVAPGTSSLKLDVRVQGCHETDPQICYPPHTEHLELPLPGATPASTPAAGGNALSASLGAKSGNADGNEPLPAAQAFQFNAIAVDPQHLLLRWTMPKGYYLYRDQTTLSLKDASGLSLKPEWPAGSSHQDANFGQTTVYFNELDLPVTIQGDASKLKTLSLIANFQGCQDGGVCYPLMSREATIPLTGGGMAEVREVAGPGPQAAPQAASNAASSAPAPSSDGDKPLSLAWILLLALGGGLILNLMPCVLPVLSIKVVGLIESGESPTHRRQHVIAYSVGVILSFLALGLILQAFRAAWGSQLQDALVVAVLALVMLAVALSMSGLVQFGASLGNTGAGLANRSGLVGAFFTGVLAVVVASPCTAPLMGPAAAYALVAPWFQTLLVFFVLGLGLALPFLAIGFIPALARLMPRPGAWMVTLKELLAFPMYLAAAWLAWVLANQRGTDAVGLLLVAGVLLAMTLWWFERSRLGGGWKRLWLLPLAVLTIYPLYELNNLPRPNTTAVASSGVIPFSPQKLAELRQAGTPVFVDMTADWCVTCKANEHAVLDGASFKALLQKTGAVYMKGDWTNEDAAITAFLQQYHSPGVPLYVVFPKNHGPGKQLPSVLTDSLVSQALTEAAN